MLSYLLSIMLMKHLLNKCSKALLPLLLLFYGQNGVYGWRKTIYVSPSGNDTLCQTRPNSSCRTLDKAFMVAQSRGANSTLILVQGGHYNLTTSFNFTRLQDFALKGTDEVVTTCYPNVSLAFVLSDNLVFANIKFSGCGNWHKCYVDKPYRPALFITALYFNYCRNITMYRLRIHKTPGLALNMYDVGTLTLDECEFVLNKPIYDSRDLNVSLSNAEYLDFAIAGGGIYLELGSAGLNPIELPKAKHDQYVNNHSYTFSNCNFTGNKTPRPEVNVTMNTPALPFSRGGGLAVYISGNGSHNKFVIEECTFQQNEAQWGGGLQVEVIRRGQNNSFIVKNTTFRENEACFAGGGVRMGYLDRTREPTTPNHFQLVNCKFIENYATLGGGLVVYGTTQSLPNKEQELKFSHVEPTDWKMAFSSCLWRGNRANVGSAISAILFNTNEDEIGPRIPFHLELENCTVIENKVDFVENLGQGAIYTLEVPVKLKGQTSVKNNSYTALVLDTATLHISDNVLFSGNTGFQGGAIALYGKSKLFFTSGSTLTFDENYAVQKGGAIYYNTGGSRLVSLKDSGLNANTCFVSYEKWYEDYDMWNISIVFKGNKVKNLGLGDSIYATTLKNCIRANETRKENRAFSWKFVKFLDKNGTEVKAKDEIRTDPISMDIVRKDWEKPATEVFNVTAVLKDEKGNHVPGKISVELRSKNVALATGSLFLSNDKILSLQLLGNKGDAFNVTMTTVGQQIVRQHIDNLSLQRCKDGFRSQNKHCVCSKKENPGIAYCKAKKGEVYIKNNHWAGISKTNGRDGKFITHYCPTGYCSCTKGKPCLYVQGKMCKADRDGDSFICGSCKNGSSVLIGSEDCGTCDNIYLLLVIPYAVILFVLVMLIMMINIDVFTGYLNAWLYSYQVITVLVIEGFQFDPFIGFIIGVVNLRIQVGKGWCLMKGIDDADKLALMYLMPTYILIVVLVLAKLVRIFPNWCFSRRILRSQYGPFGGVCTILVICYTDIVTISLKILNPCVNNHTVLLYQDGDVPFFGKKHILYGVIALVYGLVIGLLFPLTLLCRRFFVRALRRVVNLNNLRGVYDSLQDVLKDEYRWSAAFYFLCRLALLLLFIMESSPLKRALLEATCVLVLVVFVHMKPYKTQYNWINTSDTILLTNLTLITIFSSGTEIQPEGEIAKALKILIHVLVYVPLALLAFRLWRRYCCTSQPVQDHDDEDAQLTPESTTDP